MRDGLAWATSGQLTGVVAGEVTGEVQSLQKVLVGEMKRTDIQAVLALQHRKTYKQQTEIPVDPKRARPHRVTGEGIWCR